MVRKLLILACVLAGPAWAQSGAVQVSGAWARASAPTQADGVVYLTLLAPAGDTLLSVASPQSSSAMLHQTVAMGGMGGMSGMQDMDQVALPAGQPVAFAPNGRHIMLMGLKAPLVAGQKIQLELHFAKAPPEMVTVPVAPLTASGPTP